MLNLREYRARPARLADHLKWAALVAPGIVLNKDGSLQRTIAYRGPDLESATPDGRSGSKQTGGIRPRIRTTAGVIRPPGWSTRNAAPSSKRWAGILKPIAI